MGDEGLIFGPLRIVNSGNLFKWAGKKKLDQATMNALRELLDDLGNGGERVLVPALPEDPDLYWVHVIGNLYWLIFVEPGNLNRLRRAKLKGPVIE